MIDIDRLFEDLTDENILKIKAHIEWLERENEKDIKNANREILQYVKDHCKKELSDSSNLKLLLTIITNLIRRYSE